MSAPLRDDLAPEQPTGWAARARSFANLVSGLMFAAVFVIFNYKIVTRYLKHDEAVWADEISVILFIWIIFWASAFLVRDKEQITFDLVYRHVGDRTKRWMALARLVLVGGIFVYALPGSIDYILFLWRERTPVLDLRLDYVYACFGIFLVAVVVRSVWGIVKLAGPQWRRFI
jgi:TRAP-type C4-dicarboxylate transport system permease small subunit